MNKLIIQLLFHYILTLIVITILHNGSGNGIHAFNRHIAGCTVFNTDIPRWHVNIAPLCI